MSVRKVLSVWPAVVLSGCVAGYQPDLGSPDPAARIRAIRQVADRQDHAAVPLLVNRLEDEDDAVRFYAITALVRMTGTDQGYKFYAPESERLEAVKRWRRFIHEQRPGRPSTQSISLRR
jgi:hypothetical protein